MALEYRVVAKGSRLGGVCFVLQIRVGSKGDWSAADEEIYVYERLEEAVEEGKRQLKGDLEWKESQRKAAEIPPVYITPDMLD